MLHLPRSDQFLSTLPARGATPAVPGTPPAGPISIHAPREGSDVHLEMLAGGAPLISIHAPREGSDSPTARARPSWINFYPRSPRGERPFARRKLRRAGTISIHAPREGSDRKFFWKNFRKSIISIHAPREGSDAATGNCVAAAEISIHAPREGSDHPLGQVEGVHRGFLSTLPARGAT